MESKRAWAARNAELKRAMDQEYRSRPEYNERRRARYVRKTPKPPTDPAEREAYVRNLSRLRDQRLGKETCGEKSRGGS